MAYRTLAEILNDIFSSNDNTLNTTFKTADEVLNLIHDPDSHSLKVNVQGFSGESNPIIDGEASTYAGLPSASDHSGEIYIVTSTTGIPLINRKQAGMYRSDGVSWTLLDVDMSADKVYYAGLLTSGNVKDALDELRTDTYTKEETNTLVSGVSAGSVITAVAGTDIIGHTAVVILDDTAYPADSTNAGHINMVAGVAKNSCSAGGTVYVQVAGLMSEQSWAFAVGLPVFVGSGGALTQGAEGLFLMQVGAAVRPDEMIIDLKMPIRR